MMNDNVFINNWAKPTKQNSQEHSSGRAGVIGGGQLYLVENNLSPSQDTCIPTPGSFIVIQDPNGGGIDDLSQHDCNATNDAEVNMSNTGGTLPYSYTLLPANAINNSGIFNGLSAGNYTIVCTDANNCATYTATYLVVAPYSNMCCIPLGSTTNTVVTIPNIILLNSPMASFINTTYGVANVISNKTFYIDGAFDIDDNITFDNCTLYFATSSIIYNSAGFTLNLINNTSLEPACESWQGIQTQNNNSKVAINTNSTIKKASYGIHASNNAIIEAQQANFIDCINAGIYCNGITTNPYAGFIKECNFANNTPLPAPYFQTEKGIWLEDVVQMNIGNINDANSGNHFTNLKMGIHVKNNGTPISTIGVYNSTFENIIDNSVIGNYVQATKVTNCYTNKHGAAIWAKTNTIGNPQTHLDVRNTNPANTNLMMQNCDKGIVAINTNVIAKNLFLHSTLMGVMCNNTTAKTFDIQSNTLNNAFIGMQFGGDNGVSVVNDNSININVDGISSGLYTQIWPIGIDVKNSNNSNPSNQVYSNNNITLNGFSGIGINFNNTSDKTKAYKNTINLTNADEEEIVCMDFGALNGIAASNVLGTEIEANSINGNTALQAQGREDISGILINNSNGQQLHCNQVQAMRFGITALSECLTDANAIKGNTISNGLLGMAFRHLGTEGTFGDIGLNNYDNNNQFVGTSFVKKVFKFCEDPLPYQIFTDPFTLAFSESGSVNIYDATIIDQCKYDVANNLPLHTTYSCPIFPIAPVNGGTTYDEHYFDVAEAIAIASNTKIYTEYPEISYWLDCRKLYKQLAIDIAFRNSHTTLLNFYNTMYYTAIRNLHNTDDKLKQYLLALQNNNSAAINVAEQDAKDRNNEIPNTKLQDFNERQINTLYFKILEYGMDSLSSTDSTFIVTLAQQCPYVSGTAVHKARTLNSYYYPAQLFDDLKICNNIGVYRQSNTGTNNYAAETKYLQNLQPIAKQISIETNTISSFSVYPNPTSNNLTIKYNLSLNEKGVFQILDIEGRLIQTVTLSNQASIVTFDIIDIAKGIYTYKFIKNNIIAEKGKLIIE